MKFLCEQCKAKYQISDDKVAGKTVRMKCRKCGHMIEVRAEVTETSVSRGLPKDPATTTPAASPAPGGTRPSAPAAPKAPQAPRPGPPRAGGLATSLAQAKPAAPRAPAAKPAPPGGERSSALAGAFQKSVKAGDLDPLDISASSEWYVAINGVPVGPVRVTELRRKAALGAVTEESLVWQEGMEEWRPVRTVTELASLVREAKTTGPRPSIANEGRASQPPPAGRASQPPERRSGIPPRPAMQTPAPAARSNVVPFARTATAEKLEEEHDPDATEISLSSSSMLSAQPARGPAPAAGAPAPLMRPSTPSPASPKPATAAASGPVAASASGGLAAIGTAPGRNGASSPSPFEMPMPSRPSMTAPDPFAMPPPSGGAMGAAMASGGAMASAGPMAAPMIATPAPPVAETPKKAPPFMAIAMIVLAAAFGVTAALVIFFKQAPPAPVVVTVPAPTPPPATTAPPTVDTPPPPDTAASVDTPTAKTASKGGTRPAGGGAVPANTAKTADLSDLLKGTGGGPGVGGGSSAPSGGGSSLTEDQIRSVVTNQSTGIRRTCWERGASQQSSVNVNVKMTVNGSGQVTSSSAEGNDPAVAKCIENGVRSWRFPPTGGSSTVVIPFKFVRQ